mmetsp:Transcript_28870/g.48547  ORF Transcript_28870/g.48547 Transcript_28870/m.48547 type:complete len:219 (+) Transcript_28870:251-907(+)
MERSTSFSDMPQEKYLKTSDPRRTIRTRKWRNCSTARSTSPTLLKRMPRRRPSATRRTRCWARSAMPRFGRAPQPKIRTRRRSYLYRSMTQRIPAFGRISSPMSSRSLPKGMNRSRTLRTKRSWEEGSVPGNRLTTVMASRRKEMRQQRVGSSRTKVTTPMATSRRRRWRKRRRRKNCVSILWTQRRTKDWKVMRDMKHLRRRRRRKKKRAVVFWIRW